ncbi:MAG: cupin domain-containing protein [Thermoleophilia bacterium]|nr:cupin domain-containing protein [Thermoleophilia bacterium]
MNERVTIIDADGGKSTVLPGGSCVRELISGPAAGAEHLCLGFSVWKPGTATEQMVHEVEEAAYIVSGRGALAVGGERIAYRAGQGVLIPAGVPHGVVNDSDEDLTMVYVFAHPEYPPTRSATDEEKGA